MLLAIPEIMKTETFWASVIGIIGLFLIVALIILDRWRHPELYSKKHPPADEKPKIKSEKEKTFSDIA